MDGTMRGKRFLWFWANWQGWAIDTLYGLAAGLALVGTYNGVRGNDAVLAAVAGFVAGLINYHAYRRIWIDADCTPAKES